MDYSELDIVTDKLVISRGSQRKALYITEESYFQKEKVQLDLLNIEKMVLFSEKGNAHFKRLRYFGCPRLTKKGEFYSKKKYINMDRDDFIRSMYHLFQPQFNNTKCSKFYGLTKYITFLDERGLTPIEGDYFHSNLINTYLQQCIKRVRNGDMKTGSLGVERGMFSFILKALNRPSEVNNLPSIKGVGKDADSTIGLNIELELKPLLRAYFCAFNGFVRCIKEDISPSIHPIWNEELFNDQANSQGWSNKVQSYKKNSFNKSVTNSAYGNALWVWLNQFSRIAAMIVFSFTGQNTTPLLKIQHRDVRFDQRQSGKVYFNMDKARAKDLSIDTSLGFSIYAKRFIDTWLEISADLQKNNKDKWLFPHFSKDGAIRSFVATKNVRVQDSINKLTKHLGLAHATPRILRKTKIDTLMKVTEDIFLVSMSANNSVTMIKGIYSHGQPKDHERNLSASTSALHDIARGKSSEDAVNESKINFHDVLSEYDYNRLRKREKITNESQTPLGIRCQNNKGGSANQIRKIQEKNGISINEEEVFCTDFLECFKCPEHRLVATVEDIWLMLSFRDTLIEMEQYPTMNSFPERRYQALCQDVDNVLVRFKDVSQTNFNEAKEKLKEAPHPLYSNQHSLNDLLEVFE